MKLDKMSSALDLDETYYGDNDRMNRNTECGWEPAEGTCYGCDQVFWSLEDTLDKAGDLYVCFGCFDSLNEHGECHNETFV